MKNNALLAFAVAVTLGWTSLAIGVIAVLENEPHFASSSHHHAPEMRQEALERSSDSLLVSAR